MTDGKKAREEYRKALQEQRTRLLSIKTVDPEKRRALLFGAAAMGGPDSIIGEFLKDAMPEIDRLYDEVAKPVRWVRRAPKNERAERQRRVATRALEYHAQSSFFLVKDYMLEDLRLYDLTRDNEKRLFREKLAAKLVRYWLPHPDYSSRDLREKIQDLF
jgi:hypothetical protein